MKSLPLITAHSALITIIFSLLTLPALALDPIHPTGGQRGTSLEISLKNNHISSFQEFITYQPGLSLSNLQVDPQDKTRAKATLTIAADAAIGEHAFRIRTAHEISYLRTFWVGHFPSLNETEPNNSPKEANPIPLNNTVHGMITLEDVDTYSATLEKGQQLSVETEAMRLGRALFDTNISILDPNGSEIATSDDTSLLNQDPFLSIIAAQAGTYQILIREAAYEGSDISAYRLHIGTFPRPTAIFPPGGKPGETINFTFLGDPSGPFTQSVTLPSELNSNFPILPIKNEQPAPSANPITISPLEHSAQPDSNINRESAHPFPPLPSAVHGILDPKSKSRWFRFQAKKDANLEIRVIARSLRSPLDSILSLHDSTGKYIADNDDDQLSPDSLIKWTCPNDGDYLIQIRDQLSRTGAEFVFRIEVIERKPIIAATLPIKDPNDSQKEKFFPIPRGNRYATVVNLKRENISCAFNFIASNLPAGVRMIVPEIPKSLNNFPVIFEASDDAPLSSTLSTFNIQAHGENIPNDLSSSLTDTILLVQVNNEGTYHKLSTNQIPTAVTEAIPFSIELLPPPTPIVKNGKLLLTVRAKRIADFKGKITTRLLWAPAGISGPPTTEIPPEKSEAEYELNANTDAAIGTWQICLVAEADTPNGSRTVSSSFVNLVVEEPYLNITADLASANIESSSSITASIESLREFSGSATAELLSLPHGVSSQPIKFSSDQDKISFPIQISKEAKPGKSTAILCKVSIPSNQGLITQFTAQNSTLRIDPPSTNQPTKEAAAPNPTQPPTTKPLSRLEQLRQNQNPPK